MAFSYNELYKRYEELKEKNKNLQKEKNEITKEYNKKTQELENEIIEYRILVQEKNKRLKEKDLIIGGLLGKVRDLK